MEVIVLELVGQGVSVVGSDTDPEIVEDAVGLRNVLKDPPREAVKLICAVAVPEVVGVANLLPVISPVGLMLRVGL